MAGTTPDELPLPDVVAAGAVVVHEGAVLLVHRPRYDDWSFPKGKQDPGEHEVSTAVRETIEETGVEIRLGRPLGSQAYVQTDGRAKVVHYWRGEVIGDADVASYVTNDEVDQVEWVPVDTVADRLSYPRDQTILDEALANPKPTTPLVIVRHAKAFSRKKWVDHDPLRPLTDQGFAQARAIAPLLAAYGVTRVLSSTSIRCIQTVQPYADEHVLAVSATPVLSEEYAEPRGVCDLLESLMADDEPAVVCSHRPVLPLLLEPLDVGALALRPGDMLVVHHRKGRVRATELHEAP
ncbi:MAG: NUDIX hydrolase [Actinomycetota bacterium]|nr:NUDIX hydrolase [Actinomycetota bacterium]